VLRRDWGASSEDCLRRSQVSLTLEHAVNLARLVFNQSCSVFSGLSPEVGDHLVDVVFEHRYLALRLDRDRAIPLVTAVATSAIARTWVVKLAASSLTLSVKSLKYQLHRHLSLSAQLTFNPDFARALVT